jgi:hypothetical protein
MRMEREVTRPRVQDGGETELRACRPESTGGPAELHQRLARARKEQPEERAAVALHEPTQLGGQGEDHVKVMHRQEPHEALLKPTLPSEALALRAVPVATRVVRRPLKAAARTPVEVSTKRGRATPLQVPQDAPRGLRQRAVARHGRAIAARKRTHRERARRRYRRTSRGVAR